MNGKTEYFIGIMIIAVILLSATYFFDKYKTKRLIKRINKDNKEALQRIEKRMTDSEEKERTLNEFVTKVSACNQESLNSEKENKIDEDNYTEEISEEIDKEIRKSQYIFNVRSEYMNQPINEKWATEKLINIDEVIENWEYDGMLMNVDMPRFNLISKDCRSTKCRLIVEYISGEARTAKRDVNAIITLSSPECGHESLPYDEERNLHEWYINCD